MTNSELINTKINFRGKTFKKFFVNTSWLFTEKVLKLLVNFIVGVYVVRYLGLVRNGMLAYALSVIGILSAITTIGLGDIIVRELLADTKNRDKILGTSFFLKIFSAVIIYGLIVIYYFYNRDIQNLLLLIIAGSIIFKPFEVIESYFKSQVLSKYPVLIKTLSVILTDCGKIFLILFQMPLIYFGALAFAEIFLAAVGFLIIFKTQKLSVFQWRFDWNIARSLFRDSWPLMFSSLAVTIYMKVDKIILKEMLGDASVGLYDAAVRLCEGWYFIPVAISSSLFPAIISAKKMSAQLYNARLQKLYDLLAWISILIAIPISLFSRQIIHFLYGADFIEASLVLTIYIWAGVPVFLGTANSQYLIAENYTRISLVRAISGMVINIVLNIILIPRMGVIGAAVATVVSYSCATFFIVFIPKTRKQISMMIKSILFINLFHIKFRK
ncbi:MAG: flippase [bacterium]